MQLTLTVDDPKLVAQIAALLSGDAPVTEPTRDTVQAEPKAAEKPKRTPKPKPEPTRAAVLEDLPEDEAADEEPEEEQLPETDEAEEQLPDTSDAEEEMARAVKLATDMVAKGKARKVRSALNDLKAKRVTDLKPAQLATFFEKVEG